MDNTIALPISFKHVSDNCCIDSLPPISCLFTIKYINNNKLSPSKLKTHFEKLHFFIKDHLKDKNTLSSKQKEEILLDLPNKWDIHCDLIMFPDSSFTCDYWKAIEEDVWKSIAEIFGVCRIALKSRINTDDYRSPKVEMKLGDNGIVQQVDNGIKYVYDITKNMFSKGNITEKLRISKFDCKDEIVVDLFAGNKLYIIVVLSDVGVSKSTFNTKHISQKPFLIYYIIFTADSLHGFLNVDIFDRFLFSDWFSTQCFFITLIFTNK